MNIAALRESYWLERGRLLIELNQTDMWVLLDPQLCLHHGHPFRGIHPELHHLDGAAGRRMMASSKGAPNGKKRVTFVHNQYNSPLGLYSPAQVADTLQRHTCLLANGAVGYVTFFSSLWRDKSSSLSKGPEPSHWLSVASWPASHLNRHRHFQKSLNSSQISSSSGKAQERQSRAMLNDCSGMRIDRRISMDDIYRLGAVELFTGQQPSSKPQQFTFTIVCLCRIDFGSLSSPVLAHSEVYKMLAEEEQGPYWNRPPPPPSTSSSGLQ